jgi:FkbM family methyltransferase
MNISTTLISNSSDHVTTYLNYLHTYFPNPNPKVESQALNFVQTTDWENPKTGNDYNNIGVISLLEADTATDLSMRALYLEIAQSAFEQGRAEHPICELHAALLYGLIGERNTAIQIAFNSLLNLVQLESSPQRDQIFSGLIFLPSSCQPPQSGQAQILETLLTATGYSQCLFLLSEVLLRSQMVFYNISGLRFLHLAAQLSPHNIGVNLKLGLSSLCNNQQEGFLYLHRAAAAAPQDFFVCQSLAIAYGDWGPPNLAAFWQQQAQEATVAFGQDLNLALVESESMHRHCYVPFEGMLIAVQPSFRSIVTAVLLAEADWFEQELEYWRNQIQPGMVVIDVGANVGIYALSAAQRVGKAGRVIAVEPFSGSVDYLLATCRLNQLTQVKIIQGAASNQDGEIYLSLSNSSELNQVVQDIDQSTGRPFERVPCFTLDGCCESEALNRVDFLKIDAEGHELEVLKGSEKLLQRFSPTILYENIAGSEGSNLVVAEYLQQKGYQLFRYQPYLQQLIPVETAIEFEGSLNLIAIRPE